MGIDGLNVFGSLTVNGKKLSFEDFDANKDGQVSEAEFDNLLSKQECDKLELSSIDNNADKIITKEEFDDFEQKAQVQDALNQLQATIAKDFTGKNAQYASQARTELKEFASDYVANYTGNGDMVADFKTALPTKYEEIKNNILNNTPEALAAKAEQAKKDAKSGTLDTIYNNLVTELSKEYPDMAADMANQICKKIQTPANEFVKNYEGDNLKADLTAYLESYIKENSEEKLTPAINDYNNALNSLGGFLDENDLGSLKEAAKEFLLTALEKDIVLTFNGKKCSNEAQIDAALKKFTAPDALKEAMDKLIASLSDKSIKEEVVNNEVEAKRTAGEKAFASLKGDDIHVETETINFSGISGYYENKEVTIKKQGKDGAKDDAVELLETQLKAQLKAQVQADLKAKGVPENQLDQIFETIFSQSAIEAADNCVDGKGGGLFSHSKSWFKTADLVNKFIELFNTKMSTTINEMNASSKDIDMHDVDWSIAVTNEDGSVDAKMDAAIKEGETLSVRGRGADYFVEQAKTMINRMKSTLMTKAKAACAANGLEFNMDVFNTMFDNNRELAVVNNVDRSSITLGIFSKSTINPQALLKEFATNFDTNFTNWVNTEVAKKK